MCGAKENYGILRGYFCFCGFLSHLGQTEQTERGTTCSLPKQTLVIALYEMEIALIKNVQNALRAITCHPCDS